MLSGGDDDSVAESPAALSQDSQRPLGSSHLSLTAVAGEPTPSSGLHRHARTRHASDARTYMQMNSRECILSQSLSLPAKDLVYIMTPNLFAGCWVPGTLLDGAVIPFTVPAHRWHYPQYK